MFTEMIVWPSDNFWRIHIHTNDNIFDDFLKISKHFPNLRFSKILQNLSEGQTIVVSVNIF